MTKITTITNYTERLESIHKILVPHCSLSEVRTEIEETITSHQELIQSANSDDRTTLARSNNICLFGKSGTGKTTLCNSIVRRFSSKTIVENGYNINVVPTFYTSVPSPTTTKSCAINMLKELGATTDIKGNGDSLTYQLLKLLTVARTNLIIFDEFHHLLRNRGTTHAVGEWVKNLINTVKIPIMLVGTPEFEAIINADPQIASRFPTRFSLSNFSYTPLNDDSKMRRFIRSLSAEYKKKAELNALPEFAKPDHLMALYLATGGSPDCIALLFKAATKNAFRKNTNTVTYEDFQQAYPKIYLAHSQLSRNFNPFEMSLEMMLKVQASIKVA